MAHWEQKGETARAVKLLDQTKKCRGTTVAKVEAPSHPSRSPTGEPEQKDARRGQILTGERVFCPAPDILTAADNLMDGIKLIENKERVLHYAETDKDEDGEDIRFEGILTGEKEADKERRVAEASRAFDEVFDVLEI